VPALSVLAAKLTGPAPGATGVRHYKRVKNEAGREVEAPSRPGGAVGVVEKTKRGEARAVPEPAAWRPGIHTPNPNLRLFAGRLWPGRTLVKERRVPIIKYAGTPCSCATTDGAMSTPALTHYVMDPRPRSAVFAPVPSLARTGSTNAVIDDSRFVDSAST
jgi:hypothetical protein